MSNNTETAVRKFFDDLEKNYDTKLGYDSKLIALKSEIDKKNNQSMILEKRLASKNHVAEVVGELILMGLEDQQILNLAWALKSNINNRDSLEADLKKYGSLNKANEELDQGLTLESQNEQRIELLQISESEECTVLAPLFEAARGDKVETNRLRNSIIETLNPTIKSPDASCIFKKAVGMINTSGMY